MATLLIADDHPLFREALRGAVARVLPGATLKEADSVEKLYALVESEPDADLLLDWMALQPRDTATGLPLLARLPDGRYSTQHFTAR